jgi:phage-related protein
MSATEIIQELPKLTEAERREVRRKLAELSAVADEDVALCDETAQATFQELDKQEDEDRRTRLKTFFAEWDATHNVTVGEQPTRGRTYADNPRLR